MGFSSLWWEIIIGRRVFVVRDPEVIAGKRQSCAGTGAKHWRMEGWQRHLASNLRMIIDDVKEAGDLYVEETVIYRYIYRK